MKVKDNVIKNIAAFLLMLACVIYTSRCNFTKEETTPSQITTVTIHDTIPGDSFPYIVYRDKPVPYAVYQTEYISTNIDTIAILSDYFASVVYSDTLRNDSTYYIVITDTITQNRIAGRSVWFQNLRPIAINTTINTIQTQTHQFFAGAQAGANLTGRFSFAPSVLHTSPNGRAQCIGYDVINHAVLAGYYFKIH